MDLVQWLKSVPPQHVYNAHPNRQHFSVASDESGHDISSCTLGWPNDWPLVLKHDGSLRVPAYLRPCGQRAADSPLADPKGHP